MNAPLKIVYYMVFSSVKRKKGRSKRTLEEVVKRDVMVNNISEDLVFNQPSGII